jgi:hypothetical protein
MMKHHSLVLIWWNSFPWSFHDEGGSPDSNMMQENPLVLTWCYGSPRLNMIKQDLLVLTIWSRILWSQSWWSRITRSQRDEGESPGPKHGEGGSLKQGPYPPCQGGYFVLPVATDNWTLATGTVTHSLRISVYSTIRRCLTASGWFHELLELLHHVQGQLEQ